MYLRELLVLDVLFKKTIVLLTFAGLSFLFDRSDSKMTFDCCGFVKQWEFYAKANTGTVHFQVWRPAGASYTLVGENMYTVSSKLTGGLYFIEHLLPLPFQIVLISNSRNSEYVETIQNV